jgi:hypothetical protein
VKRDLLSLWLIGGIMYAGGALIPHTVLNPSKNDQHITAAEKTSSMRLPDSEQGKVSGRDMGAVRTEAAPVTEVRATDDVPDQAKPPQQNEKPQEPSPIAASNADSIKVRAPATIRSGPSTSAKAIGTAQAGTEGRLISRDPGWVQIEDPQTGKTGWIYSGLLDASTDVGSPSANRLVEDDPAANRLVEDDPAKNVYQPKAKPNPQRSRARTSLTQRHGTRPASDDTASASDLALPEPLGPMRKRIFKGDALPPWDPYRF